MAEELEAHLQMDIDDGIGRGLAPAEARRQALVRLGGLEATKENLRDRHVHSWLETTIRDAAFALRTMRRTPGLTVTIVLTLALGIGATTAIFSIVDRILLRPLPFSEPERLLYITAKLSRAESFNPFAYTQDYPAWREHTRTLREIAGYMHFQADLTGREGAERIACGLATASVFPMLGVQPALGRVFRPEEDRPGGPDVAILDHAFWMRRFSGDPSVVGKTITLDDRSYTVIGVLPPLFRIPDRFSSREPYAVWVPFAIGPNGRAREILIQVLGRMRPGVSPDAVRAELTSLMQGAIRKGVRWKSAEVVPWQEQVSSGVRRSLLMFMGASFFVLLIACVNVANLLLGRSAARSREIAVRRALGAGSGRILRQLLTEAVLLSLAGATLGVAVAHWAKRFVLFVIAPKMPAIHPIELDLRVLVFALSLAVLTGIAFGLAPALAASTVHVMEALKEASRGVSESRANGRLRRMLAVMEIALAVMLLFGAGLFLRSFLRLRGIDLGMRTDRLLTFNVSPPKSRYPKPEDRARYLDRLLQGLQALPGVEAAAGGQELPLSGAMMTFGNLGIEGRESAPMVSGAVVSSEFFRTMTIPLLRGRAFTTRDREGAPSVGVVNEVFARRFLAAGADLGHRVENPLRKDDWLTVVGVVGDVRSTPESEPDPTIYFPALQPGTRDMTRSGDIPLNLVARTSVAPMSLASAVRSLAASIDASLPVFGLSTLEDVRSEWVAPRRANAILVMVFAALALLLGGIGVYGVLAAAVGERTHELGIRIALGARRIGVVGLVLRQGAGLLLGGIVLGGGGSLLLARWIAAEVWGIRTIDPLTFGSVILVISAAGLLACAIPARRAVSVDPVVALRCE